MPVPSPNPPAGYPPPSPPIVWLCSGVYRSQSIVSWCLVRRRRGSGWSGMETTWNSVIRTCDHHHSGLSRCQEGGGGWSGPFSAVTVKNEEWTIFVVEFSSSSQYPCLMSDIYRYLPVPYIYPNISVLFSVCQSSTSVYVICIISKNISSKYPCLM